VKPVAVFLSGLAATGAGAFIRSCSSGAPIDLAAAWCGEPPPGVMEFGSHAHCAGCALAFAGLMIMCLSAATILGRSDYRSINATVVR
jgi:hypothetical protein